jgi:CO/xanthine dehydrogenase FAD-binding subunit
MRSIAAEYNLVAPKNLRHALRLMNSPESYEPFAGGTDLMVLYEAGVLGPKNFVSILGLPELSRIQTSPKVIRIGAGVTYTEILRHRTLSAEFPMLGKAAELTGAVAIQNRGTIGGNIANASPAADSPPALLAYGARLELTALGGQRRIDYSEFHTGYRKTLLRQGELITAILLPRPALGERAIHYYRKVGSRAAQAISKVCLAGYWVPKSNLVRIAVGSVAPVPLRLRRTELFLQNIRKLSAAVIQEAQSVAIHEISPIDDIRSTAEYRSTILANLLHEFMRARFGARP